MLECLLSKETLRKRMQVFILWKKIRSLTHPNPNTLLPLPPAYKMPTPKVQIGLESWIAFEKIHKHAQFLWILSQKNKKNIVAYLVICYSISFLSSLFEEKIIWIKDWVLLLFLADWEIRNRRSDKNQFRLPRVFRRYLKKTCLQMDLE